MNALLPSVIVVSAAPLPSGWRLEGEWLYDWAGYARHVRQADGAVDKMKVASILDNHGHEDYARHWTGTALLWDVAVKAEAFAKAFIRGGTADNAATLSALEALAAALLVNKATK